MDLRKIDTERRNPRTMHLDQMTSLEIVEAMNAEDQTIAASIAPHLPQISRLVDVIVEAFESGHRLFYIGAGTSGRLGVLDASECVPTFGVAPTMVTGLIAGSDVALRDAVEGAEDNTEEAERTLLAQGLSAGDVVVGLAASGRTPYVQAGLAAARKAGCKTGSIACSADSEIGRVADIAIDIPVGPEVLTGSTRLKAGTAQKMVLNMLSTAAMVRIGKAYENLMIDVVPSNEKLRARAIGIVREITGVDEARAHAVLEEADGKVKVAVAMLLGGWNAEEASARLADVKGHVREAVADAETAVRPAEGLTDERRAAKATQGLTAAEQKETERGE